MARELNITQPVPPSPDPEALPRVTCATPLPSQRHRAESVGGTHRDGKGYRDDSVRISVGGHYQSGEPYRGQGTVHIKCPQ